MSCRAKPTDANPQTQNAIESVGYRCCAFETIVVVDDAESSPRQNTMVEGAFAAVEFGYRDRIPVDYQRSVDCFDYCYSNFYQSFLAQVVVGDTTGTDVDIAAEPLVL